MSQAFVHTELDPVEGQPDAELIVHTFARHKDELALAVQRRYDLDHMQAQSAVQSAATQLWEAATFNGKEIYGGADGARALLRTVAAQRAADLVKRSDYRALSHARSSDGQAGEKDVSPLELVADREADPDELLLRSERVRELIALVKKLPPDERLIIAKTALEGYSLAQIRSEMGWTADQTKKRAAAGFRRVRKLSGQLASGELCRKHDHDVRAFVSRYASPEQSERARQHLAECPQCRRATATYRRAGQAAVLIPLPVAKGSLPASLFTKFVGVKGLFTALSVGAVIGGATVLVVPKLVPPAATSQVRLHVPTPSRAAVLQAQRRLAAGASEGEQRQTPAVKSAAQPQPQVKQPQQPANTPPVVNSPQPQPAAPASPGGEFAFER